MFAAKENGPMDENHRTVAFLTAQPFGETYALVEVGANIVNSIEQDYDPHLRLHEKGTQKAHFNFGSTVMLVIPSGFMSRLRIVSDIDRNASCSDRACEVKRGTAIMYDRSVESGTYRIADGINVQILNRGGAITETRMAG